MSRVSTLVSGRRAAEADMVDTFTAYEPGTGTDADGFETRTWASQGSTKGKFKGGSARGDAATRLIEIGSHQVPVLSGALHLPVSATVPDEGWEYVCTAVSTMSDVALLGRRFRVVGVPTGSEMTARRLDVAEVPQ